MIRSFLLTTAALLLLGCSDSEDKSGDEANGTASVPAISTDTTLDAVSSATKKFKLNGGTIYDDSLAIDFWYLYDNGDTWALIIDENSDTVLCDTLNTILIDPQNPTLLRYPLLTDNIHVMKPLKPATTYFLIMDGLWYGDVWPLDTVEFKTRSTIK